MKGAQAGKEFLDGVLAKITDPGAREAAAKAFADATVQLEVGNGVAGQSEIDRQLRELRTQREELDTIQANLDQRETSLTTWHGQLSEWHEKNKNRPAGGDPNNPNPNPKPAPTTTTAAVPPNVVTTEQYEEAIGNERLAFLGFQRDQNLITREHFSKFNEIVDLEPLLKHPQIKDLGLKGVYELVHKARLDEHTANATKAREDALRAEGAQAERERMAQMPYPVPTGVGSGSPLDALTTTQKDGLVDAATAHYNRLQAERNGTGAAAR